MMSQEKSLNLFERAQNYMPGPHSNLRAPARVKPLFMDHGQGAKLWDVDGNEYIDFVCCYGPGILGHGNPEYNQALKDQVDSLIYLSTGDFRTVTEEDVARALASADRVMQDLST